MWAVGAGSDERGLGVEAEFGDLPDDHGLPVPDPGSSGGVGDPHHGVSDLVDATGRLVLGAVWDPLSVDVEVAPPFAVVVPIEAEVEAGAEMEPGVGDGLDRQ